MSGRDEQLGACVEQLVTSAQAGIALDVERVLAQPGAFGQNLTVTTFAYFEVQACKHDLSTARALQDREDMPIESAADFGKSLIGRHVPVLSRRYGMTETADLMAQMSEWVSRSSEAPSVAAIWTGVQDYLHFLSFMIMLEIPWNELSCTYEGARKVRRALGQRMVG